MKNVILSLMAAGMFGLLVSASAQPASPDDNTNAPPVADQAEPPQPGQPDAGTAPDAGGPPPLLDAVPGGDNAGAGPAQIKEPLVITPSRSLTAVPEQYQSNFLPPQQSGTNANDLNLHFTAAPLEMVLNYLSDAAGFIIIQEARINNNVKVTVNGKHLTRTEAADLLNSVLNQNGLAAIRDGRTLTIVDKNEAKTREIPVRSGNDPAGIPRNAEIVTQIIPIRFVEAQQLVSDLSSFVSPQATVVANEAGNSIVITDTQANIHHLAEIIRAIDDSAEAETEIQVFPLKNASPTDVAAEISSVFPSTTSGGGSQSPIRFGGPGGFGAGGFGGRFGGLFGGGGGGGGGGRGGAAGSSSNDRIRKATQVNAVADGRIQAVIVTAPKDLMQEIGGMIEKLDVPSDRDQNVYVFTMKNGDAQQTAQVLQGMFQGNNSRTQTGQNQNSALQQRIQNNTTQMGSQSSSGFGGSGGLGGGGGGGRAGGLQY